MIQSPHSPINGPVVVKNSIETVEPRVVDSVNVVVSASVVRGVDSSVEVDVPKNRTVECTVEVCTVGEASEFELAVGKVGDVGNVTVGSTSIGSESLVRMTEGTTTPTTIHTDRATTVIHIHVRPPPHLAVF